MVFGVRDSRKELASHKWLRTSLNRRAPVLRWPREGLVRLVRGGK